MQFQGMIAEYERAQIAERCRARQEAWHNRGGVNVLSGAPYRLSVCGRRATRRRLSMKVIEPEARVVRTVFEIWSTQQGLEASMPSRVF